MKYALLLVLTWTTACNIWASSLPLRLWYRTPASYFEEALPIGNGTLGAMIYGGVKEETIYLNDITFWTGKPVDRRADSSAHLWIPKIREALFQENYPLADSLQLRVQGSNSQYYQPLATLSILNDNPADYRNYHRELSIDSALVRVRYQQDGVTFSREYFASHPDKVIVLRLSADKRKSIRCKLRITAQVPHQITAVSNGLQLTGHAHGDARNSIHYCTLVQVAHKDGTIAVTDSTIALNNVSQATVYLVNRTSFNGYDQHPVTQGAPYREQVASDLKSALARSYNTLRARHIQDYISLFKRLQLSLAGAAYDTQRTTEQQLKDYTLQHQNNPYLETLYFQFGRYLLIASSRTAGVPANLQGIWNRHLFAPWRANYTMNINLEENYWLTEVANLSEMFMPLRTFVKGLSDTGASTAKNYYGIDSGWCASHNSDIWAMTNPVGEKRESPEWANWNLGGAWLMSNMWEHFLFQQDFDYLRAEAYPLMKGAAEFMLRWLIPNPLKPDELITAPSTSPENNYVTPAGYRGTTCYGGTADLAILRELFANTAEAARLLGVDHDLQVALKQALSRFHPYTIGHMGDLNEWYHDWDDYDFQHRHQTHLIGLFPGHHLSPETTPALAQAARRTLELKGDKTTGWSTGWRLNLWARLRDEKEAYHTYRTLLNYVTPDEYQGADRLSGGGTYPNLLDAHPPFQIDGNFGGTAGVCEMLIQSGNGMIELLPALPQPWSEGSVSGLRARGAYEVAFAWKNRQVTRLTLKSLKGGTVKLKYNGTVRTATLQPGETINL